MNGTRMLRLVTRQVIGKHAKMDSLRWFSTASAEELPKKYLENSVFIKFIDTEGDEEVVEAEIGENILDVAHDNDIELEGACGGEVACSTCACIFEQELFDKLPEISEDEEDMLDLAVGVTDTTRLGCQVIVTKEFENTVIKLPSEVQNMQSAF
jgi:ferredoxin